MSVLFQGVYADPGDPLFVPYAAAISTASLLQNNINVSSIVTNHITLDQVNMDSAVLNSVPTLLLNGQPVATGTSFTSSVTSWASFPALSTINYNVAGSGAGVINMTNVNALTNVSSATATFGTLSTIGLGSIGGSIYPSAPQYSEIVSMRQTVSNIQNKTSARLDFSAQANGYYLVTTNLDSADEDPFSCSFVIWKTTGNAYGGGTHMPTYGVPLGTYAPNPQNVVTCLSETLQSPYIDLWFFSNGNASSDQGMLGAACQIYVFRLP